tara:strand:+ start:241 stop:483 length:243 start_codon:yes stop_codon:yes gene_type:complete
MKNQLTANQQNAMNIFDDQIVSCSDWADEGWDRVFINQLIDTLVGEGWTTKSAEGTVGSLCETEHLTAEGWDDGNYILCL